MSHCAYDLAIDTQIPPWALLIRSSAVIARELDTHYFDLLPDTLTRQATVFELTYDQPKRVSSQQIQCNLHTILNQCLKAGIRTLFVCDAEHFKKLTKERSAENHLGSVKPCKMAGFEDQFDVILGFNHQGFLYDDNRRKRLPIALNALSAHLTGNFTDTNFSVVHHSTYYTFDRRTDTPRELATAYQDIQDALDALHQYAELTCDIEGFALDFYRCGVATISFSWGLHEGITIQCDWQNEHIQMAPKVIHYGVCVPNPAVRAMLKTFFEQYQGKLIYHNANFDLKVLIFTLFMGEDFSQTAALIHGLNVMTRDIEDTKIIAYLATNNCGKNTLGLKPLSQPFAGNYALDVKDIRLHPLAKLMEYNLIDGLCTWYVHQEYRPLMLQAHQQRVYDTIFKPSIKVILQMEITGLPLNMDRVREVEKLLKDALAQQMTIIQNTPAVIQYEKERRLMAVVLKNEKLKTKQVTEADFAHLRFNPSSPKQLQELVYQSLGYPILQRTPAKQPATGGKLLRSLGMQAEDEDEKALLFALAEYKQITTVLQNFIKNFLQRAIQHPDGHYYLHGSFNLGGTVSGRLSSSDPNMQNINMGVLA